MSRPPMPNSWWSPHKLNEASPTMVGNPRLKSWQSPRAFEQPFIPPLHTLQRRSPSKPRSRPPTPQLVAAFSKEMADADGEMLAEYGAMDAMEPLPQKTVERELDMEAAAEINEHQA